MCLYNEVCCHSMHLLMLKPKLNTIDYLVSSMVPLTSFAYIYISSLAEISLLVMILLIVMPIKHINYEKLLHFMFCGDETINAFRQLTDQEQCTYLLTKALDVGFVSKLVQ